jgi:predicted MPP superfamily phosphohydrolase
MQNFNVNFLLKTIALAATASIFFYGFVIEPAWIEVTRISKHLDLNGDQLRIAQLSDLHITKMGSTEWKVLEKLNQVQSEIILMSGDVIDDPMSLPALELFLQKLPSVKKFAILGNWEHWSGIDIKAFEELYRKYEVTLLINDCVPLSLKNFNFSIAGLDDYTAGNPELQRTLSHCTKGAPIILAQHSPGLFDEDPSPELGNIVYSLAGHTHGGQIAIGQHAIFTPRGSGRYVAGLYKTRWGDLYVSRGVGTSVIPLRLGARPEIVILELN